MSLHSRFTGKAYFVFVVLTAMLAAVIVFANLYTHEENETHQLLYLLAVLLTGAFMWYVIVTELKNKMVKVIISPTQITLLRYAGLFQGQEMLFKEFDGYLIQQLEGEDSSSEFCFLIKEGKKVFAISDFYHKNYSELKAAIQAKLKKVK